MFAHRYFTLSYWAGRFFPPEETVIPPAPVEESHPGAGYVRFIDPRTLPRTRRYAMSGGIAFGGSAVARLVKDQRHVLAAIAAEAVAYERFRAELLRDDEEMLSEF